MCVVMGLDKDSVEKQCKACSSKGENCQIAACLFSRAFSAPRHADSKSIPRPKNCFETRRIRLLKGVFM